MSLFFLQDHRLVSTVSGRNIHLHGGANGAGIIDGNGQIWWDTLHQIITPEPLVAAQTFARPVPHTIGNARNVVVEGIAMIASPIWNNFVYQSKNVTYKYINISSKSSSINVPVKHW